MKFKTLSVLMGGLLAAQFATAAVEFSYQLTTSDNLTGFYTFTDSGLQDYSYQQGVGMALPPTVSETATVLKTYQVGNQWFQDVSVTSVATYTQDVQMHSSQYIDLYYSLNSSVNGNQRISLTGSLTDAQGWGYSVSALGTPGAVEFGGNEFQVSPALAAKADGVALSISSSTSFGMGSTSATWSAHGSNYSPVNNTFEAGAAAIFGGSVNTLGIRLSSAETVGAIETHTWSDVSAQTITQMIAAPVPEPESYAMLLAGLGLMGAIARKRKQQA